ncbi:hypothetical protein QRQ56_08710 [Bradyrhizobium sp. U531]|uniref:hypothetical protein n=1 Tax=Bradyrhizobium sp. U531 TaxID=3053458 RepID=UPI003F425DA6
MLDTQDHTPPEVVSEIVPQAGAEQRRSVWWKNPTDIFTCLVAVFTAVLALVAYLQYLALSNTDKAIHDQLKIMQSQLEAMIRDQMPTVSLDTSGGPSFEQGDKKKKFGQIGWNVTIRNTGKTEATDVKINKFMRLEEDGVFLRSVGGTGATVDANLGNWGPGHESFVTVFSPRISSVQASEFLAKRSGVSILVDLTYRDVVGQQHIIAVCHTITGTSPIGVLQPEDCQKQKAK